TAKGREWPLVFLIGAEDDLLPIWSCKTLAELEEERRVLYVAMTRAKQRLCISWAKTVSTKSKRPSRFLQALPADLICCRG
ncbi:MAG: ATP-dependent helicase, partial [Herpetosiphonaceae bacterium]|nr:ATP-dependent helicase [Herpetosiphonaceae bacterium]